MRQGLAQWLLLWLFGTAVMVWCLSVMAGERETLIEQLKTGEPEAQVGAARQLSRLVLDHEIRTDDREVLAALRGVLFEGHVDAAHEARWALSWMGMSALDIGAEALRSEHHTVVCYGAHLLADLARRHPDALERFEPVIAVLSKRVNDEDRLIRRAAIQALCQMGDRAIPGLIRALSNPRAPRDERVGRVPPAVRGLAEMGKASAPALAEALGTEDVRTRIHAGWALARMPEGEGAAAMDALLRATRDADQRVRRTAAGALGAIGPEAGSAVPRILAMMEQGDGDFSGSLWHIGLPAEQVDRLLALMPGLEAHTSAPRAMATAGPEAVPALIRGLSSETAAVRRGATIALAHLGKDAAPAAPALIKALERREHRSATLWALGAIGPEAEGAVPALIELLKDDQWAMPISPFMLMHRSEAAKVLARIGKPAVPALIEGLSSDSGLVQAGCVQALAAAGQEASDRVIPEVLALLRRADHPVVKGLAMNTLIHLGTPKDQLLPVLQALQEDTDPRLVRWAKRAEQRINEQRGDDAVESNP